MFEASAVYFESTCCSCFGTEIMDHEPDGCPHCGSAMVLFNEITGGRPETSSNIAPSTTSIRP